MKGLIFDADDTLWDCSRYYWDCRDKFAKRAAERTGLSYEYCMEVFSMIDGEMLKMEGLRPFSRTRFPTAFKATSVALDVMADRPVDETAAQEAWNIGDSVFYAPYKMYEGVIETLKELRTFDYRMVLITKGDEDIQNWKVDKNGVREYFDAVYITGDKSAGTFLRIMDEQALRPDECITIGDSMRDDVATPNELGCTTVWVSPTAPIEWKPRWEYEAQGKGFVKPDYWIRSLPEILYLPIFK